MNGWTERVIQPLPPGPLATRLFVLLAASLLAALGLTVYRNSLDVPFVHDDERSIRDNPRIRTAWPFGDAGHDLQTTENGRPVVRLSLALNHALGELELAEHGVGSGVLRWLGIGLGGTNVRGYHVFNLCVHVLSALVLFGLVWRTLERSAGSLSPPREAAPFLALIAAAIWLVHPLNTDAVTYTIQRTELLMGLFYLSTLLTASMALDSPRAWAWCSASVLCCALGMGSKESMASAPILVALHDRAFAFPSWRAALRARSPLYAGLACTWVVLALLVHAGPRSQTVGFDLGVAWWRYAATQLGMILHYLRLSFWPDALCLDYGRALARTAGEIVPGALVVGALAAATTWALFRRPALGFLGAGFFLVLAPSSSVVPIVTEVGAERRMYLPLAALVVLVVLGAHRLAAALTRRLASSRPDQRARIGPLGWTSLAALVVVVVFGGLTVRRNADYADDLTLWLDTVEKRPRNPVARNNLARAYSDRRRFAEALEHLSIATTLPSCPPGVVGNLGNALINAGRLDESMELFRALLRADPTDATAHCGLGLALLRQERWSEAAAAYEQCLRYGAPSADLHCNMGVALLELGQVARAAREFRRALELDPTHAKAQANLVRAGQARGAAERDE